MTTEYSSLPEISRVSPAEYASMARRKGFYSKPRKSFEKKVEEILAAEEDFITANHLKNGQIFQLQQPSSAGGVVKINDTYIEDIILVTEKGNFNFVANLSQSKNCGIYQRKAIRVLKSLSFVVLNNKIEPLFENFGWLFHSKVTTAMEKLAKIFNYSADGDLIVAEVKIDDRLHLKAARVQKFCDKKGHEKFIVVSMNSGKIWILNPEELEIISDIRHKKCIMTQFVYLRQMAEGDYMIIS